MTHIGGRLTARPAERPNIESETVGRLPDPDADSGHALAESFRRAQSRGELAEAADADELGAVLASMLMEGMLRWAHGVTPNGQLDDALRWRTQVFLAGLRSRA